jgi:hypothetical protein
MEKSSAANESSMIERRLNARLRSIFPDASFCIAAFFHGSHDWMDTSIEYLAHRLVHESYPSLSPEEIRILVAAVERQVADGIRQYQALEAARYGKIPVALGQRFARP